MEGPSLFVGVSGNTTIEKIRFEGRIVKDIFSWGKHLLFQFDGFALKVHFLMFGTFSAWVEGKSYRRLQKTRVARLALTFENGQIDKYNCSVKIIEHARLKTIYDDAADLVTADYLAIQRSHHVPLLLGAS